MSRQILIVAPYLPWPADFGGAIRIYQFVRHLSHDRDVILLAPASASEMAAVDHLREICDVTAVPATWTLRQPAGIRKRIAQVRSTGRRQSFAERASWDARFQAVMDRLFMTRHIELVQYEFPQMARYRPLRPCPTILDNHNVEHLLLGRVAHSATSLPQHIFNNVEWRKVRRLERAVWTDVTLNIATSTVDADRIHETTGQPVPVVPNGVDATAFDTGQLRSRAPGRVVFVGAMRHRPNADGARWYAQHVHPLVLAAVPHTTFEIVGADPPADVRALERASITVVGRVASVVPHLAQASVAVAPLHSGGGTRLKILEAFAAGVPVVSTTLGAEGLDVLPGEHMLVADTPSDFADAVIRVLGGRTLPAGYSTSNARELVRARYDWSNAVVPALLDAQEQAITRFEDERRGK